MPPVHTKLRRALERALERMGKPVRPAILVCFDLDHVVAQLEQCVRNVASLAVYRDRVVGIVVHGVRIVVAYAQGLVLCQQVAQQVGEAGVAVVLQANVPRDGTPPCRRE